eukprot:3544158-Pyramimonas_sp.AAC.1
MEKTLRADVIQMPHFVVDDGGELQVHQIVVICTADAPPIQNVARQFDAATRPRHGNAPRETATRKIMANLI